MEEKLLQFYKATLQDPLFAAEGMDLEQGLAALDRIERQCKEAESLVGADSWMRKLFLARYPIAKYAFPIPFLRAFIESERARRAFVLTPTHALANRLLVQWKKTVSAYERDVHRYTLLHTTVLQIEGKPNSFQFEDFVMNVTTLADVWKVLESFKRNAQALKEDVSRREALLVEGLPYKVARYVAKLPPYKPTTISEKHQHLIDLELQNGFPFREHPVIQTFGPFAYTLKHLDAKSTEHAFYAFILEDRESQSRFLKISLADRFYFMDLTRPLDERNRGLQAPVIERGLTHWFQSMTHGYGARDQLYVADMATMIDLELRPWLDRERISLQRSSMLDLILMGASFDLDMYLMNTRVRARGGVTKTFAHSDSVLIRTHPSIFYLPFNASVWRLESLPNFLGARRGGEPKYKELEMIEPGLPSGMLDLIMQGARIRAEGRRRVDATL